MDPDWQRKPLPTLPGISQTKMGAIENIPRQRTTSSTTAGELIRRVSNIFSSRKKRPPALQLANRTVPRIYESSLRSLSDEDEEDEEDGDIRRPSGLGSAVSISSLPQSPFSPSHNNVTLSNNVEDTGPEPSHMPFGYIRARATSTPNLLRSFSLRSKSSKCKARPRNNSGLSSREGTTEGSHTHLQLRSSTPPELEPQHDAVIISSIPVETISLIFTYLSASDIAQIARTCHLFLSASWSVLYTHIDLDELTEPQLEKFVALLASRRDFTDLVRTFSCSTWPRFFLPTISTPLSTFATHSPSQSRLSYAGSSSSSSSSSPLYRTSTFLSPSHHDPDTQHRNTLLTATFTLAFQRMSNLTSLTLPSYDHDLLTHHTAFGLQSIKFTNSTMLEKIDVKELFGWLDGQINVVKLEFPNLGKDCDFNAFGEEETIQGGTKGRIGSGLLRQNSAAAAAVLGGAAGGKEREKEGGKEKKFLVAPYLVPLDSSSSPKSPKFTASPNSPKNPSPSPRPNISIKNLSPRPKSAAPSSPSYATFPPEVSTSIPTIKENRSSPTVSSPNSPSQIPFPTSTPTTPRIVSTPSPSSPYPSNPDGNVAASSSALSSPTLLPNLTTLHGPPSLIIALSSSPVSLHDTTPSSPISSSLPSSHRRRPLHTISLNINSTLYTGLRPSTVMAKLVGVTRVLSLYFGEGVDKRSLEKCLGAAGSSLGGVRERSERGEKKGGGELKEGFTFGQGEWKGLVELNVGFVESGPGSDETLHRMISSAVPRYPYLRALTLSYIPQSASSLNVNGHPPPSPFVVVTPTSASTTNGLSTTNNMLPTPPYAHSPLPTTPTSFTTITSTSSTATSMATSVSGSRGLSLTPTLTPTFPPRSDSLKNQKDEKKRKGLSPPEQAYVRQWTKHCVDLEKVVFLSGAEWVKTRGRK